MQQLFQQSPHHTLQNNIWLSQMDAISQTTVQHVLDRTVKDVAEPLWNQLVVILEKR